MWQWTESSQKGQVNVRNRCNYLPFMYIFDVSVICWYTTNSGCCLYNTELGWMKTGSSNSGHWNKLKRLTLKAPDAFWFLFFSFFKENKSWISCKWLVQLCTVMTYFLWKIIIFHKSHLYNCDWHGLVAKGLGWRGVGEKALSRQLWYKRTMVVLYRSPDQTNLHIYCWSFSQVHCSRIFV